MIQDAHRRKSHGQAVGMDVCARADTFEDNGALSATKYFFTR